MLRPLILAERQESVNNMAAPWYNAFTAPQQAARNIKREVQMVNRIMGAYPAQPFPQGLDWINTGSKALTLEGLRGKLVLLDFWTYG